MHTAGKIDTRCTIMCAVMKSLSNALWCQYLKINNSIKISRPNGWQNVCQAGLPQSKQNVTVVFPCNCIFDDDIKKQSYREQLLPYRDFKNLWWTFALSAVSTHFKIGVEIQKEGKCEAGEIQMFSNLLMSRTIKYIKCFKLNSLLN